MNTNSTTRQEASQLSEPLLKVIQSLYTSDDLEWTLQHVASISKARQALDNIEAIATREKFLK